MVLLGFKHTEGFYSQSQQKIIGGSLGRVARCVELVQNGTIKSPEFVITQKTIAMKPMEGGAVSRTNTSLEPQKNLSLTTSLKPFICGMSFIVSFK